MKSKEDTKEDVKTKLKEVEDWLNENGSTATKEEFESKLKELRELTGFTAGVNMGEGVKVGDGVKVEEVD